MVTINHPNGQPYLTITNDENLVKIEMHAYTKQRSGKVFFVVDKRCLPELIKELSKLNEKK